MAQFPEISCKTHLQICNKSQEVNCGSGESFHQFSRLPKELRLKIWRSSLQRERMIEIHIDPPPEVVAAFRDRLRNLNTLQGGQTIAEAARLSTLTQSPSTRSQRPEPTPNGWKFGATVRGRKLLSKLLRVNREARQEAHVFYRVRMPCNFTHEDPERDSDPDGTAELKETLLLNPEYDFVYLKTRGDPYYSTVVAFLTYIKTSLDPRHVGILNLALDIRKSSFSSHASEPWEIWNSSEREIHANIFNSLWEVFFITRVNAGRQIIPLSSGIDVLQVTFNRSTPIHTHSPQFYRVAYDERPIEDDLRQVYTSHADPHTVLRPWHALLECLGATRCQARCSWLLSYNPQRYVSEIFTRDDAETFVRKEDDAWYGRVERHSIYESVEHEIAFGRASPDVRTKNLHKAARPAFGYWLFPLTMGVGDVRRVIQEDAETGDEEEHAARASHSLQDLSAYRPGLLLADFG